MLIVRGLSLVPKPPAIITALFIHTSFYTYDFRNLPKKQFIEFNVSLKEIICKGVGNLFLIYSISEFETEVIIITKT
jgi:hypothetical protein